MLSVTVRSALGFSESVSLELARAGNLLVLRVSLDLPGLLYISRPFVSHETYKS